MQNTLKARGGMGLMALMALVAIFLAVPTMVWAQGDGRFSGTMLDQSGAFVPGATVSIRNQKTV